MGRLAAKDVYFTATKKKPNNAGCAALDAVMQARRPGLHPDLSEGRDFDDQEMRKRYPRLSTLYTGGGAGE